MKRYGVSALLYRLSAAFMCFLIQQEAAAATCVECHSTTTPGIVTDWKLSKHGAIGLDCAACHGKEHNSLCRRQIDRRQPLSKCPQRKSGPSSFSIFPLLSDA